MRVRESARRSRRRWKAPRTPRAAERAMRRETRHADSERARVAEEAGRAVERAISQREWALEVLDREVEAQEAFGKKLAYEMYLAGLLAMPEAAVSVNEETDVAGFARAVAAEHRSANEKLRELARSLHDQVAALPHIREAARAAGVAAGWTAALAVAAAATAKAGPREWPATNRLREQIHKGREDARREASRGGARRSVLRVLGSDLEPTCEDSRKRTIERLMMPSEPSLKRSGDAPETKKRGDAGDARAVPGRAGGAGTPGTPGTDYFYDAETPTTFAESSFRARDHFYDAETSTPERLPAATTPVATPAGEPEPDPEPDPVEEEADGSRGARGGGGFASRRGGPGAATETPPNRGGVRCSRDRRRRRGRRRPRRSGSRSARPRRRLRSKRRAPRSAVGKRTRPPSRRGGKSSRSPRASVYEARRRVSRHEAFAEEIVCVLLLR